MIKILCGLCLLTLISCGKPSQEKECLVADKMGGSVSCALISNSIAPSHRPLEIDPSMGVPNEALTFVTNLDLVNFEYDEMEKVSIAADLIRAVIASSEFRDEVYNHTFKGERTFNDNEGLSNEEIYQVILEGAERLNPIRNNALDVKLELYYENTNIIGYTYPSSEYIWLNRKYFSYYSPVEVSGNLFHEWLHKLGFKHSYEYNADRKYSVPYAIGYIMARLAKQHIN